MDWLEGTNKWNTSVLLQEFEKRFTWLSTLDRTVLDTSKVLLFIKSVDPLDQEKMGLLLETDEGLTLWEVLGIVNTEFYNGIIDLVKRKWLLTEPEPEKLVEVKAAHVKDVAMEEECLDSHYMKPH